MSNPGPNPPGGKHEKKELPSEPVKVGRLLANAFDSVSNTSQLRGLETSKWASAASVSNPAGQQEEKPDPFKKMDGPSGDATPTQSSVKASESRKTADVDDAAAFMAAVRGKAGAKEAKEPKVVEEFAAYHRAESEGKAGEPASRTTSTTEETASGKMPIKLDQGISEKAKAEDAAAASPPVRIVAEESREHQLTFETWGTPVPRDTPGAEIRRVTLRNIPPWLASPNRILSLVHGGRVESLFFTPGSSSAQVLFCKAADCRRFYESHPNGIETIYSGRSSVVFVEISLIPDVMSSRITQALNGGATRVIRAIGADMDLSMAGLASLSEGSTLKPEKIVDTYTNQNQVRTVDFRFCSIDNALRFKATLDRLEVWEPANVQWGPDPCETATGTHWD